MPGERQAPHGTSTASTMGDNDGRATGNDHKGVVVKGWQGDGGVASRDVGVERCGGGLMEVVEEAASKGGGGCCWRRGWRWWRRWP